MEKRVQTVAARVEVKQYCIVKTRAASLPVGIEIKLQSVALSRI